MFCCINGEKIDPEEEYKEFLLYTKNYYFKNKNKQFKKYFENEYYYAEAVNKKISENTFHFKISKWYKKMLIVENKHKYISSECPICLEILGDKSSSIKLCKHTYHTKCILKYINYNKKNKIKLQCPICRRGPDLELINKKKRNEYFFI